MGLDGSFSFGGDSWSSTDSWASSSFDWGADDSDWSSSDWGSGDWGSGDGDKSDTASKSSYSLSDTLDFSALNSASLWGEGSFFLDPGFKDDSSTAFSGFDRGGGGTDILSDTFGDWTQKSWDIDLSSASGTDTSDDEAVFRVEVPGSPVDSLYHGGLLDDPSSLSLFDHLSDGVTGAATTVWDDVVGTLDLATKTGQLGADLTLGGAFELLQNGASALTGKTVDLPDWLPSQKRGQQNLDYAGSVLATIYNNPHETLSSLVEPVTDAWDEGRYGLAAGYVAGSFLDPLSKVAKPAGLASDLARSAKTLEPVATGARRVANAGEDVHLAFKNSVTEIASKVETANFRGNTASWYVDDQGRTFAASATLNSAPTGVKRSGSEKGVQKAVGDSGLWNGREKLDSGGHIVGHRYIGNEGTKNQFPQDKIFNSGAYNTLEQTWEKILNRSRQDVSVDVEWQFDFKGNSIRPDHVSVNTIIRDSVGEIIDQFPMSFPNTKNAVFTEPDLSRIFHK